MNGCIPFYDDCKSAKRVTFQSTANACRDVI